MYSPRFLDEILLKALFEYSEIEFPKNLEIINIDAILTHVFPNESVINRFPSTYLAASIGNIEKLKALNKHRTSHEAIACKVICQKLYETIKKIKTE